MGAAGAIEAVACIVAMNEGFLHPTAGVTAPMDTQFHLVTGVRERCTSVSMSNSFGFGGSNAVLILGSYDSAREGTLIQTKFV